MRVFTKGIQDDLFVGLWVGKSQKKGGDLKKDLVYKKGIGITKPDVCSEIKFQYDKFKNFRIDLTRFKKLELFFEQNFFLAKRFGKTKIMVQYKSENWQNMIFFHERKHKHGYTIEFLTPKLHDILPILSKNDCLVKLPFPDICALFGKTPPVVIFNEENRDIWEEHLEIDIRVFYLNEEGKIHPTKNMLTPAYREYDQKIDLVIKDRSFFDSDQGQYFFLANDKLFLTVYKCQTLKCSFESLHKRDFNTHQKQCDGKTRITSKQVAYGDPETLLEFGVRMNFLPEEARHFRQRYIVTFDIECLESDFEGDRIGLARYIEKRQKLISLAIGSNLPGTSPKFFCRRNSQPETEQEIIKEFLDHLDKLHELYMLQLPPYINQAIEDLESQVTEMKFCTEKSKLQVLLGYLKKYTKLRIYGFNAGKLNLNLFYYKCL